MVVKRKKRIVTRKTKKRKTVRRVRKATKKKQKPRTSRTLKKKYTSNRVTRRGNTSVSLQPKPTRVKSVNPTSNSSLLRTARDEYKRKFTAATSTKEKADVKRKWLKRRKVLSGIMKQTGKAIDKTVSVADKVTGWAEKVAPEITAAAIATENPIIYAAAAGVDALAASHQAVHLIKHTVDVAKGKKKDQITLPSLEAGQPYQTVMAVAGENGDTLNMIDTPPEESLPAPLMIEGPRYRPWPDVVQMNKRQKTSSALVMDVD